MTMEQFIRELLKQAQARGIQPAEVYAVNRKRLQVRTREGEIESYQSAHTGGLSLRGMVSGKMGYASTQALDEAAIEMLIEAVIESAGLVESDDPQDIFAGSPAYPAVETFSQALADMPAEDKLALALAVDRAALAVDPRVGQLEVNALSYTQADIRLVNSFGLDLCHQDNGAYVATVAVAREGEHTAVGEAEILTRDLSAFDIKDHAEKAAHEAVAMLAAQPVPSGTLPVLLDRTVVGSLLGVFAGSFSAENAQQGLSLLAGREGEAIAAAHVTLMDDPLLPGGPASRGFDDEGVATQAKAVIEEGVLKTLLHNRQTARKQGVESTGNGARGGYSGPVHVAPMNFFLKPGGQSLAALMQQMEAGLYITEVSGLHAGANPVSGDFSLLAKGYRVEGGKQDGPVHQITVAGNFYTLLQDIVALADDLAFDLGSIAGPSVWVRSLSVAGK